MSLKYPSNTDIPEGTARVVRTAFPKGNIYLTIRDEIGVTYSDSELIQSPYDPEARNRSRRSNWTGFALHS